MSKSDAEKIEFILNKHEQAYRGLYILFWNRHSGFQLFS